MLKLLQINVTANWGSTGKIAEDIGLIAKIQGWQSYMAYGRNARDSQSELIRIGTNNDIKVHVLCSRIFDNQGLNSKTSTKYFIRKIEEIKPDIIHLHNIHGYYLNYELLFQFLAHQNKPLVWTMHDCWPFTGHCGYFDYAGCEKWKTGCQAPCPCKGEYPESWLFDRCEKNWLLKNRLFTSLKNVTLVPVSNWLAELVKQSFLGKYPIRVIHNGINTDVFKPQGNNDNVTSKYNLTKEKLVIGVASVWDKRKGLTDFLRLRKMLPDNYLIALVGVSAEQQRILPEGIVGIKRTQNQQELAQLYSLADVFVNPTYEDNFPTTNLEALACGTPVVTYNTGGAPESITTDTGVVVEKGDINGLVLAIKSVSEKGTYSYTCRKRAEDFFDKGKCFEKYISLYDSLLKP